MKPESKLADSAADEAEASLALAALRRGPTYTPLFRVLDFRVSVGQRGEGDAYSEATIKLQVGHTIVQTAAEGNGPVSALDAALRKALLPIYPGVGQIVLLDYRVRIVDGNQGTAATTRVSIESRDGGEAFKTAGSSTNIIVASLDALIDSIEFGLLRRTGALADIAGPGREAESR
jgi:2-isopropylmalate synthase